MRLRFNIRQIKALVWIACLSALAYDGWSFWDVYQKKQNRQYAPRSGERFGAILHSRVEEAPEVMVRSSEPEERYQKLWTAKVEGRDPNYVAPEVIAQPEAQVDRKVTLKPLEDVVEVSLIFYSSEPLSRFAAVVYKEGDARAADGKRRRLHLREGEPLKEPYDAEPYFGAIKEIREQQVVFTWGEEEVVLDPGLGREGAGKPVAEFELPVEGTSPLEEYEEPPRQSLLVKEGEWIMGTADKQVIAEDPQSFLSEQVRVRTRTPGQGERGSIELMDVDENSIVYKYGGRAGDRIISVNGFPMTSTTAAVNWFKSNSGLSSYVVKYETSMGQEKTTTIHVPQ